MAESTETITLQTQPSVVEVGSGNSEIKVTKANRYYYRHREEILAKKREKREKELESKDKGESALSLRRKAKMEKLGLLEPSASLRSDK